ncbi:MAG: hypothetical protein CVT49_09655 [candidate division Zixibacteria bacterium HGW-Zixibacteria-1]|nr:MAG: hypothetical protein CVT49_09655 [candidate division Zixibacteria bacterium HGW-Zixibacteria-1]
MIESAQSGLDEASARTLQEHLDGCPECAALARAERMLDVDFAATTADDNAGGPDLAALRRRTEEATAKQTVMEKIMSHIKYNITERPRLMTGLSVAVAVFLFITLVPFSYTETTGYRMTLNYAGSAGEIPPELLNAAFAAIGYEAVSASVSSDGQNIKYVIDNIPTRREADDIGAAVGGLIEEPVSVNVEPIIKIKSGALYAQVITKIKGEEVRPVRLKLDKGEIVINDEGLSGSAWSRAVADYQVQLDIERLLAKKGLNKDEFEVKVETVADGDMRMIELRLGPTEVIQTLKDGILVLLSDSTIALRKPDPDKEGEFIEKSINIRTEDNADSIAAPPVLKLMIKLKDEGE